MATETITLKLVAQDLMSGNVSKAIGSLDKLAKQGGLVGSVAQGVGQSIGQMVNPLTIASKAMDLMAEGAAHVISGLSGMAKAYREDQAEQAQFTNTLVRNIRNFEDYTDEIDRAIIAGQKLAFTDSEQRQSLGRLITATRDARKAITLNRLAMDIARQRNIKLSEASAAVTKAAQGQYRGLKSLGYIVDATAGSTQVLADVTTQAADAATTWANTEQGKLAARLVDLSEKAENSGKSLQFISDAQDEFAVGMLDTAINLSTLIGVVADFTGVSKDAEGQTIAQAQSMENLGRRLQAIGWSYDRTAELIKKDYGGIARAHDRTLGHLVQSFDAFIDPWRKQWADAAAWAKDPFSPKKFENQLKRWARKAARNAAESFGSEKERWTQVSAAYHYLIRNNFTDPTITDINRVIAAMRSINAVTRSIGGFRRNGSTGLNPNAQIGDTGGVGDFNNLLPGGGSGLRAAPGGSGGGAHVNVSVTHIGSMSEADGQRMARTLGPHISRELGRAGR